MTGSMPSMPRMIILRAEFGPEVEFRDSLPESDAEANQNKQVIEHSVIQLLRSHIGDFVLKNLIESPLVFRVGGALRAAIRVAADR